MVEAKDNHHSVGDGMQQALDYAETLAKRERQGLGWHASAGAPLPEHRIVERVDELAAICDRLETGLNRADAIHSHMSSLWPNMPQNCPTATRVVASRSQRAKSSQWCNTANWNCWETARTGSG